jgi:hypothetical protein
MEVTTWICLSWKARQDAPNSDYLTGQPIHPPTTAETSPNSRPKQSPGSRHGYRFASSDKEHPKVLTNLDFSRLLQHIDSTIEKG